MTITWNDTEIGGHKCASVTIDEKRLYVAERFGKIEAWIDAGQDRQLRRLRRGQDGRSQNSALRTLARRPIVAFCSKPPRHLKQNPRRRFEGRSGAFGWMSRGGDEAGCNPPVSL